MRHPKASTPLANFVPVLPASHPAPRFHLGRSHHLEDQPDTGYTDIHGQWATNTRGFLPGASGPALSASASGALGAVKNKRSVASVAT